jgi:hypothetical protein
MVWSAAFAETRVAVNVPAGDLTQALESLARQCGIDIIYPSDQLRGRTTPGISGTLEPTQAVKQLLDGTSLTLSEEGGALLITQSVSSPAAAAPRASAEPLPQVEIQAQRAKLSAMRKELDRLETQFFKEYNRVNADPEWDVHCTTEIPTGSHVGIRVCRPEFVSRAMRNAELAPRLGRASPSPYTLILQKTPAYQRNMIDAVRKHPELLDLVRQRAELAQRYEVERRLKLTGKTPVWP